MKSIPSLVWGKLLVVSFFSYVRSSHRFLFTYLLMKIDFGKLNFGFAGIKVALLGLNVTQMGKQIYILQDMKFGGTPLHWSCSRQVIDALLDMECDINSRNFAGRTALHIMVLRKRLECVVALLSRNADVNIGDHDGNTPLHLAVIQGVAAVVQALVIFGADLSYKYDYLWYYLCFSAVIRSSKEV